MVSSPSLTAVVVALKDVSSGSRLCFELKMHFSIPETEVRSGENGSTYVVSMIMCGFYLFIYLFCLTRFPLACVKCWLQLATGRANVTAARVSLFTLTNDLIA